MPTVQDSIGKQVHFDFPDCSQVFGELLSYDAEQDTAVVQMDDGKFRVDCWAGDFSLED